MFCSTFLFDVLHTNFNVYRYSTPVHVCMIIATTAFVNYRYMERRAEIQARLSDNVLGTADFVVMQAHNL
jgi:hypothetical protein